MSFLYREAGRVLKGVEEGRASLKSLTFKANSNVGGGKTGDKDGPKRKLYAMVSETLRFKPLLDKVILMADPEGGLFAAEHVREKEQGYIMLYEMLFGKGSIQGGGALKRHLMQHKPRLEKCLAEAKMTEGLPVDASNEDLLPKHAKRQVFPRYARVNLLTCPEGPEGVAASLRREGFTVEVDDVVPSLLVLPAGTELHTHAMVKDGRLVLQDKSSCFSAEALLGEHVTATGGSDGGPICGDVIDACAAPGNKTMHLASLLSQIQTSTTAKPKGGGNGDSGEKVGKASDKDSDSGRVFAFDKDPRRLALMRRRVNDAGLATVIDTKLQDFLETDPADPRYSNVTAILLDPSCSGSGIVSAPERLYDGGLEENGDDGGQGAARVKKLAEFQLAGLLKAMSFPQVQRVCYSTCSIHVEENEGVVMKALQQQSQDPPSSSTSGDRFVLSRRLPKWHRRGLAVAGADERQAACMVRADPTEDQTNGFFVAVFERQRRMGSPQQQAASDSATLKSTDGTVDPDKSAIDGSGTVDPVELGDGDIIGNTKKRRNRHKNRKKKKRKKGAASTGQAVGVAMNVGGGDAASAPIEGVGGGRLKEG